MSFNVESAIAAVSSAARNWLRADYPPRVRAIDATLRCQNAFTRQAVDAAIDWTMSCLDEESLSRWVGTSVSNAPKDVLVLNAGNVPFVGLQDFLAVVLSGHRYHGVLSSKTPHFLPAFAESVSEFIDPLYVCFGALQDYLDAADVVLATGSQTTMAGIQRLTADAGLGETEVLLRKARYSVAVLDGGESEAELAGLAEDCLLHEGRGCLSVAVIFAPDTFALPTLTEACNRFRATFPAHEATVENTELERRLFEATGRRYVHGTGFLLVESEPNPRIPGVVVCSRYRSLSEVERWLTDHEPDVQAVVTAKERLGNELVHTCYLGRAQRPPLDWKPDGIDTLGFLSGAR